MERERRCPDRGDRILPHSEEKNHGSLNGRAVGDIKLFARLALKFCRVRKKSLTLHCHRSKNERLGWPHYRKCGFFMSSSEAYAYSKLD